MKAFAIGRLSVLLAATIIAVGLLGLAAALVLATSHDGALAADTPIVQADAVPTGTVVPFIGSVPPPGWLLADGSEVSRTQYAQLFAVAQTTYGGGNGTTTFNLPDLRGRVIAGVGIDSEVNALGKSDGLGVTSRKVSHKHGLGTLAASGGSHTHTINDPGHTHTITDPGHSHSINDPGHRHNDPDVYGAYVGHGYFAQYLQTGDGWNGGLGSHTGPLATTGITVNSNTTGITGTNSRTTGITVNSSPITLANSAFSGLIGNTSGPTDGPAYQGLNYIVKS